MFCIPDGRCYGLRRTRAFRGFGACIRCPIVLHPGRPLLRLTPLYNSDPTPAPPSGRGIGSVRNSYQRITLSESLCDAWPHAYAARMLYTPNGRSYGLRRCTDYTLPLNLPPREGDLLSLVALASGGARGLSAKNRIAARLQSTSPLLGFGRITPPVPLPRSYPSSGISRRLLTYCAELRSNPQLLRAEPAICRRTGETDRAPHFTAYIAKRI